jgi:tagatose 1,6-diphosphate aldolase
MNDPEHTGAAEAAPLWPLPRWGKHWGLRRLADTDGFFSMVAIDQRPPIVELVAKARGIGAQAVCFDDIVRAKALLAEGLAPHASALLVDPNFGCRRPPRISRRHADSSSRWRNTATTTGPTAGARCRSPTGRWRRSAASAPTPSSCWPGTGPTRERPCGRTSRPSCARSARNAAGTTSRSSSSCWSIPSRPLPSGAPEYREDPAKQARLVLDSVRTFADPAYGIDLFKLESPLPMAQLPAPGAPGAAAAQALFDEMGAACAGTPWVMLSAGASMASFEHAIGYACRAGASGFLAGRAVWWEALGAFPDGDAVRRRCRRTACLICSACRRWRGGSGGPGGRGSISAQ